MVTDFSAPDDDEVEGDLCDQLVRVLPILTRLPATPGVAPVHGLVLQRPAPGGKKSKVFLPCVLLVTADYPQTLQSQLMRPGAPKMDLFWAGFLLPFFFIFVYLLPYI
eukprot:TRINITY_DN4334_c0_g1_i1.p1 TRINITY_DN4334_c0_g1~~TRINITY_DN4334_c0_g1_i1.p1  ORF type:complete len:108 (+),score=9.97 TRINITY_DN4334_c0_g1_i1:391-714(+)